MQLLSLSGGTPQGIIVHPRKGHDTTDKRKGNVLPGTTVPEHPEGASPSIPMTNSRLWVNIHSHNFSTYKGDKMQYAAGSNPVGFGQPCQSLFSWLPVALLLWSTIENRLQTVDMQNVPAIELRKNQRLHFSFKLLLTKADHFASPKHADITQSGAVIIPLEAVPAIP